MKFSLKNIKRREEEGKHKRTLVLADIEIIKRWWGDDKDKDNEDKDKKDKRICVLNNSYSYIYFLKQVSPKEEKEEVAGDNYFHGKKTKIPLSHNNKKFKS